MHSLYELASGLLSTGDPGPVEPFPFDMLARRWAASTAEAPRNSYQKKRIDRLDGRVPVIGYDEVNVGNVGCCGKDNPRQY